jgi:acyl transferase domain-containing protein
MPEGAEPEDEYPNILAALGSLWLQGCDLSWSAFHQGETRRRVALPSYPFQRRRFWLEPGTVVTPTAGPDLGASAFTPIGFASAKTSNVTDTHAWVASTELSGDRFVRAVRLLIEELLGSKVEAFDEDARFIMLGLDSLMLTQLARTVRVRHGLEVTFRDLVERLSSPRLLAGELRTKSTVVPDPVTDAASLPAPAATPETPATPAIIEKQQAAAIVTPPSARRPRTDRLASLASQEDAIPFARLGRDENGHLAWYVPDLNRSGKFLKVSSHA